MEWFNEKIETMDDDRFIYKVICFLLGGPKRRLSYKELFMILYGVNKRKLGEKKAKEEAMNRILTIYKNNHKNNFHLKRPMYRCLYCISIL